MPKDEFDFEDPLELNGVALFTNEDTMTPMAECFVEEFMRLGYNHKQIFALFRNPHYVGMNMVLQNKGESFVRDVIAETFARRGQKVQWPATESRAGVSPAKECEGPHEKMTVTQNASNRDVHGTLTDPMGAPVPDLTI